MIGQVFRVPAGSYQGNNASQGAAQQGPEPVQHVIFLWQCCFPELICYEGLFLLIVFFPFWQAEVANLENIVHHEVPPSLFEEIERFALKRRGMKKKRKKKHHHRQSLSPKSDKTGSDAHGKQSKMQGTDRSSPTVVRDDPDIDMFAL